MTRPDGWAWGARIRSGGPAKVRRRGRLAVALALALLLLTACGSASSGLGPPDLALGAGNPAGNVSKAGASDTAVGASLQELRLRATVDAYLSHMTLDEKLGQMIEIEIDTPNSGPAYYQFIDTMISQLHAGGMIVYIFGTNWPLSQLRDFVSTVQAHASIPLFSIMDEEGGVVDRLQAWDGPRPAAQDLAATGDPHNAYLWGAKAAHDLQAVGINTDLAPVVDVRLIPNQVEWTRLYGNDPATVDRYAGAFLQGLQQNGEIGSLKHWPGIGSIWQDPHLTLPTIERTRDQLVSSEFAAFRGLLPLQPGMIMVTHVMVPVIDQNLPATLSPALINGVLRGQLGYNGVVVTDNLYMEGIRLHWPLGEAAVLAVLAGVDLLATAWDPGSMTIILDALRQAIAQGRITMARIDQSVRRILLLKARYGLLPVGQLNTAGQAAARSNMVAHGNAAIVVADRPRQLGALV